MRSVQVDSRLVGAGVLAGAVALLALVLTRPADRELVLTTVEGASAGIPLGELELDSRLVEDPAGLILERDLDDIIDRVLLAPLGGDTPIPASLVVPVTPGESPDLLGLSVDSAAAVHGRIVPGDRVAVYSIEPEVELVARAVAVVDVEVVGSPLAGGEVRVVLALPPAVASSLVGLAAEGTLHLVREGN